MFFSERDLAGREVLEGITLKAVAGAKTMMTFFDFAPGAVIPPHRHPNEQITYVLEGEMEFTLEGERKVLGKGEGVLIPSGKEHGARVLPSGPAKAVDAWYPPREDYAE